MCVSLISYNRVTGGTAGTDTGGLIAVTGRGGAVRGVRTRNIGEGYGDVVANTVSRGRFGDGGLGAAPRAVLSRVGGLPGVVLGGSGIGT